MSTIDDLVEVNAQRVFDVAQDELREIFNFGVIMGRAKSGAKKPHYKAIQSMTESEYQAHIGKRVAESLNRIADLVGLEVLDESEPEPANE